ncbi:MAG: zinc-binding dehydrogenase [Acidimicrobiia bacterium]
MKGVVWFGREEVRLGDVEMPERRGDGQAIVEVTLCGLCGTDFHECRSGPELLRAKPHPLTGEAPPLVLGHEILGVVADADSGTGAVAVGTRVAVDPCWRCDRCAWCREGRYHLCRWGGAVGLVSNGGLAPLVRVPAAGLAPVPDAVDDDLAALAEPLSVGLHAVGRGGLRTGDDVLVVGCGPIGAAVALFARLAGAARVVVADTSAARADGARHRLDVDGVLVPEPHDDLRSASRPLFPDGAHVVFDCTGSPPVVAEALRCTRRGGRLVVAGIGSGSAVMAPRDLVLGEREVIGALGYCWDLPRVLALMARGAIDAAVLAPTVVALADAPGVLLGTTPTAPAAGKILVDPR